VRKYCPWLRRSQWNPFPLGDGGCQNEKTKGNIKGVLATFGTTSDALLDVMLLSRTKKKMFPVILKEKGMLFSIMTKD
jgi:hypothetical protein